MKNKELLLTIALLSLGAPLFAATNDPTALLQKALFEEEANHNIPAAIQAYQSLVNNLDENRKLAATAIFRLGECYRKQGKTNEAAAQYERLTRDFSDQTTLSTLSSQNLAGMGRAPAVSGSQPLMAAAAAAEAQRIELDAQIQQLKDLSKDDLLAALEQNFPDASLKKLAEKLRETERNLVVATHEFGEQHPDVLRQKTLAKSLRDQIDQEASAILKGLQVRRDTAAQTAKALQAQMASAPIASPLSEQSRQEQKRLLEEEIKLVEKDLSDKQKLVEMGNIGQDAVREKQRELLVLKRQLAALDLGATSPKEQAETTPAGSTFSEVSESLEIKRLQATIKDSPDLINATDGGQSPLYTAAQKGQLKVAEFLLANGAAVSKEGSGGTPLHAASKAGNKAMVELLLSHGANVNAGAPGPGRDRPLHIAANEGLKTICEILISHGADVNARATRDYTPLHYAAQKGFKSIVELLLAHGADVDARDSNQATALFLAVQKQQVEVGRVLLSHKADPNLGMSSGMTPLHFVAHNGTLAMAQLLLTNHANVNMKDNSGNTPLHEAASTGQPGMIEALLAHKADINAKNNERATPLITAIAQKQWSAAKLLIANKADLNFSCSPTINNSRQSDFYPIHVAMLVGSDELLELLLKNGADPNAHTNQSVVPLAWAINNGRKDWADLLLKYKADPNLRYERFPLLISAINQGRTEIGQALLEHGADANEPDPDGRAPLLRAVSVANKEMVKALLDHKADVNSAWRGSGDTPLYLAVSTAQKDVVDLLLAHGADPNIPNKEGKTPLMLTRSAEPVLVSTGPGTLVLPSAFPAPGQGATFATRLQEFTNPNSTPAPAAPEPPNEIRDLLLKHGATEDLPHLDRIEVRRSSARNSTTVRKGTNDWNQFTLYELIAMQYQLVAASSELYRISRGAAYAPRPGGYGLPYPDFAHIRIRHPAADRKSWEERTIELSGPLSSGDCSADLPLQWGDVVEIPEEDHPLNVPWLGLSDETLASFKKCLTREIEVIVKGQSKKITLSLEITPEPYRTVFFVGPVLQNSKLLLASSDLAHIKVRRTDPKTKTPRVWTVDCSYSTNQPDFWLEDGDVIEVPDRT